MHPDNASRPLSLGVSIVLYLTTLKQVEDLIAQLIFQGAARVYIVDNSPPWFDTFHDWVPSERVVLIRTRKNLGYGAGNNIAIEDSARRHEFHLICNPDIELGPGALIQLAGVLRARPEVGLCMPKVVGLDGELHYLCKRSPVALDYVATLARGTRWGKKRRADFQMRHLDYNSEMQVQCLSGCFMFFRSAILRRLQGFDDGFFLYFEDFDLSRRAAALGANIYFPAVYVIHGHARGHRHSLRLRLTFLRSAVRYFNKWGWL